MAMSNALDALSSAAHQSFIAKESAMKVEAQELELSSPSSSSLSLPTGTMKPRQRFAWTPELHHSFEEAVLKLGLKSARPRHILTEMRRTCTCASIAEVTRDNISSHLQKYRARAMTLFKLSRSELTDSHGELIRKLQAEGRGQETTIVSAPCYSMQKQAQSQPAMAQHKATVVTRQSTGSVSLLITRTVRMPRPIIRDPDRQF
ncbi:hypothetical protein J8273_3121 [Carpediemonas membranifera]|uniref:Uncharacterized protein n=1 Tax=Carpediemonas membranifera TaxID=201153 RepID=A0A8J6EAW4_9EUKA|nr:hypothetical protein J8273_3121 [Carpediemonas membranifera]|eukprot:KAG9395545.1 hypothetical protein J8273_3121 [Carpediemonas membranifera]